MSAVALLAITAAGTWHFGGQFLKDLRVERQSATPIDVPQNALAALKGETRATTQSLPIHLVNMTAWNMTSVTLTLETIDKKAPLTAVVTQIFSVRPWAPGDAIERGLVLGGRWAGRQVRYAVISAEGFQ